MKKKCFSAILVAYSGPISSNMVNTLPDEVDLTLHMMLVAIGRGVKVLSFCFYLNK